MEEFSISTLKVLVSETGVPLAGSQVTVRVSWYLPVSSDSSLKIATEL